MASDRLNHLVSQNSGSFGASKVAIPRLQRSGQSQGSRKDRQRVQRACTSCHSHKIKCSGGMPTCKHCESTGRECVYTLPRKNKLKIATERCVQMAGLLKELTSCASEEDNTKINELLDALEDDLADIPQTNSQAPSIPDTDDASPQGSKTLLDSGMPKAREAVDVDPLDLLDEDLHQNDRPRATGFVGKNSEIQWLRTLLQQERSEGDPTKAAMPGQRLPSTTISHQVSTVTFYLDGENIDPDYYVEPYDLPTEDTAKQLLAVYMDKVHGSFPILSRILFEDQFHGYFKSLRAGTAPRLDVKWQAILNLVFAIGARYSHLTKTQWLADERDHFIYQARARTFGWNESTLSHHPDLPQIQVAGLLAFYYLSVGQVNRAWVVVGLALRFAFALGLHVRNGDPSASGTKREVLVRIWWSLYSLDRQLSVITGRPSVIVDSCCSVPLPTPLPEETIAEEPDAASWMQRISTSLSSTTSTTPILTLPTMGSMSSVEFPQTSTGSGHVEANSGSYFRAVVQIGIITQSILSSLYTAGTMIWSPGGLQQDIVQLAQRLDRWAVLLPADLNFQTCRSGVSTPLCAFFRERTLLEFQFLDAKILLTWPCLSGIWQTRIEEQGMTIAASFSSEMANICVEAAKMKLDLLPDLPNPEFIYEHGPWWSIVHHLMQALAVFLIALSSTPASQDRIVMANYAKKTVRWLRGMDEPLAERAYQVGFHCFEIVATQQSLDISNLRMEHTMTFPKAKPSRGGSGGLDPGVFPMTASGGYSLTAQTFAAAASMPISHCAAPSLSVNPVTLPLRPDGPLLTTLSTTVRTEPDSWTYIHDSL